jgi:hypothetical protein
MFLQSLEVFQAVGEGARSMEVPVSGVAKTRALPRHQTVGPPLRRVLLSKL